MRTTLVIAGLSLTTCLFACASEERPEPTASQTANQRTAKCERAADGASTSGGVGGKGGLSGGCTETGESPGAEASGVAEGCRSLLGSNPGRTEWDAFARCVRASLNGRVEEARDDFADDAAGADEDSGGEPGQPGRGGDAVCIFDNVRYECVAKGQAGAACGDGPVPPSNASQDCRRVN